MPRPSALVVAYYYPPVNSSGTFRTTSFVRHLVDLGWNLTVLTTGDSEGESVDPALMDRVPEAVSVLRAGRIRLPLDRLRGKKAPAGNAASGSSGAGEEAGDGYPYPATRVGRLRDLVSWFLRFPDKKVGWILPAIVRAWRDATRPDVILASGPPSSGYLVAVALSRLWGVPFVLDFRDPWVGNVFNPRPYAALTRSERLLESWCVRRAHRIVAVTEEHRKALQDRFPWFADRFVLIPNGYDRETIPPARPRDPGRRFEILHAGLVYGRRDPHPFLRAVARLCEERPDLRSRIRVTLVGPIGVPFTADGLRRALPDPDVLSLVPGLPHREALQRMADADVLLLLGLTGDEPEVQIPGKLYEYLGCGRPILTLSHPQGAMVRLLRSCGMDGYVAACEDEESIRDQVVKLLEEREQKGLSAWTESMEPPRDYDRARLTARLSGVLEDAAGRRATRETDPADQPRGARGRQVEQA